MMTTEGITAKKAGMNLNIDSNYDHSATTSGVSYRVRVWYDLPSKMAYAQIDAYGIAVAEINIALPSMAYGADLNGASSQSLFLNIIEFTSGGEVSSQSNVGALIISKDGDLWLYIKINASMIDGSSDAKVFRLQ